MYQRPRETKKIEETKKQDSGTMVAHCQKEDGENGEIESGRAFFGLVFCMVFSSGRQRKNFTMNCDRREEREREREREREHV